MESTLTPQETILRINIKHSKPVEVTDFITSLNAINKLYAGFVKNDIHCDKEISKSKLYVEKIKECCIEVYLKEIVTAGIIPFMENINVILEFSGYLKRIYDYFKTGDGEKPSLNVSECENLSDALNVISNDPKGHMTFGAVSNGGGNIYNNCTFNFGESNGIQKQLKQEADTIREIATNNNTYERVLMAIYQVRTEKEAGKGNKAIVDEIAKGKKVSIVFATDELRDDILYSESNPTQNVYQVDITVQTLNDVPIAYKITALHDIVPLEKDEIEKHGQIDPTQVSRPLF